MKCGIYVMIRNGKVRILTLFTNSDYRNSWSKAQIIEGDGTLGTYYTQKGGLYCEENVEKDMSKWWANGNIICNELSKDNDTFKMQHWGDQFLSPLQDMLDEACNQRTIPDCELFLNKRNYPQLQFNVKRGEPVGPCGFIFDKDDNNPSQDVDLDPDHKFKTYAPIVSFYAAAEDRFKDIPWPSSENWEGASDLVFPQTFISFEMDTKGYPVYGNPRDLFTKANFRKCERGWDDNRFHMAFFQGTTTGGGMTIANNQRLKVSYLSHTWKHDLETGGEEPLLDAAIVGWNLRDRETLEHGMTFLRAKTFDVTAGRHHSTPIYEQSK
jgi:hypothetical protein